MRGRANNEGAVWRDLERNLVWDHEERYSELAAHHCQTTHWKPIRFPFIWINWPRGCEMCMACWTSELLLEIRIFVTPRLLAENQCPQELLTKLQRILCVHTLHDLKETVNSELVCCSLSRWRQTRRLYSSNLRSNQKTRCHWRPCSIDLKSHSCWSRNIALRRRFLMSKLTALYMYAVNVRWRQSVQRFVVFFTSQTH